MSFLIILDRVHEIKPGGESRRLERRVAMSAEAKQPKDEWKDVAETSLSDDELDAINGAYGSSYTGKLEKRARDAAGRLI
ncbi:hypothetical protein [Sinosporangium album]|nr:hypothetical protein [Sinosporangium album]